jgi:hypothetical protein
MRAARTVPVVLGQVVVLGVLVVVRVGLAKAG